MGRQAREWKRLLQRFRSRADLFLEAKPGSATVDYSRAALTSMNKSGVTLQAAGEEAFQVAPSA
jgi:hypothetical protein